MTFLFTSKTQLGILNSINPKRHIFDCKIQKSSQILKYTYMYIYEKNIFVAVCTFNRPFNRLNNAKSSIKNAYAAVFGSRSFILFTVFIMFACLPRTFCW